MTDTTVSRLGQFNKTGDVFAGLLKQFGGEVLTEFENGTVMRERHFVRQMNNGRSASFPLIGAAAGAYHTAGAFIDANAIGHAEQIITVDQLYVAPTFIAEIDEMMNHYDVRGPYAKALADVLVQMYDSNVLRTAILAARSTAPLTGRAGGSRITHANAKTDGAQLVSMLFNAAQVFDEKNIPQGDRFSFFKPAQYVLLAQDDKLIDRDYNANNGDYSKGTVMTAAGFPIVKTNNLPTTDQSADTALDAKYRGDYLTTAGVVMHRMAVGTLQLKDITTATEWEERRQGWFMNARFAVGHGKLREDCAIELATGAVA